MPCIRHGRAAIKHYTPPTIYHANFAAELLLHSPSHYREVWGDHDASQTPPIPPNPSAQPKPPTNDRFTTPPPEELIPKPDGEVTRISRGGYNLEAAMKWNDHALYTKVQVSAFRRISRNYTNARTSRRISGGWHKNILL